jgi:eukaryotic-like serine/threonine-protein kinase
MSSNDSQNDSQSENLLSAADGERECMPASHLQFGREVGSDTTPPPQNPDQSTTAQNAPGPGTEQPIEEFPSTHLVAATSPSTSITADEDDDFDEQGRTVIVDHKSNRLTVESMLQFMHQPRMMEGLRLGHVQLIEYLGGGMSAVFRGIDQELNRQVAIKILLPSQSKPELLTRFRREAQSVARLDHDNIAQVFSIEEADGLHFIIFEYIEGDNLKQLVDKIGPLPWDLAIRYTLQISAAIDHAFQREVTHRDIKPANAIITQRGRVKLVDMGLARMEGVQDGDVTNSGMTLGTFDYISPEQAKDPRSVDVRSDLYSLGCTLYFMLTGYPPFPDGSPFEKLLKHSNAPRPDPRQLRPDLPREVTLIVRKLLATNPDHRYQKPADLVADLATLAYRERITLPHYDQVALLPRRIDSRSLIERIAPIAIPVLIVVSVLIVLENLVPVPDVQPSLSLAGKSNIGRDVGDRGKIRNADFNDLNAANANVQKSDSANSLRSNNASQKRTDDNNSSPSNTANQDFDGQDSAEPFNSSQGTKEQARSASAPEGPERIQSDQDRQMPDPMELNGAGIKPSGQSNTTLTDATTRQNSTSSGTSNNSNSKVGENDESGNNRAETPRATESLENPDLARGSDMPEMPKFDESENDVVMPRVDDDPRDLRVDMDDRTVSQEPYYLVTDSKESPPTGATVFASVNAALQSIRKTGIKRLVLAFNGIQRVEPVSISSDNLTVETATGYAPLLLAERKRGGSEESSVIRLRGGTIAFNHIHWVLQIAPDSQSDGLAFFEIDSLAKLRFNQCAVTIINADEDNRSYHHGVSFVRISPKLAPEIQLSETGPTVDKPPVIEFNHCIVRGFASVISAKESTPVVLRFVDGLLVTAESLLNFGGSESLPEVFSRIEIYLENLTSVTGKGLVQVTLENERPHFHFIVLDCQKCLFKVGVGNALLRFENLTAQVDPEFVVKLQGSENFFPRNNLVWESNSPANNEGSVRFDLDQAVAAGNWFQQKLVGTMASVEWVKSELNSSFKPLHEQTIEDYLIKADVSNPAARTKAGFDQSTMPKLSPLTRMAPSTSPAKFSNE